MSDEEKRLALYSYPTSLSSPKITPTDLTFFKTEGAVKANDFFDSRYQDIIKQAEELKEQGIAVNALWPRTTIATAAALAVTWRALIAPP